MGISINSIGKCGLIVIVLVLTSGFQSKLIMSQEPDLMGQWEWVYTKGEEKGEAYHVTPESMNMKIRYIIRDVNLEILINEVKNEEYDYQISGDTLRFGQEEVLFRFSEKKDSLLFSNVHCCEDVYVKAFYRTNR